MTRARLIALVLVSAAGLAVRLCLRPEHRMDFGFDVLSVPDGFLRVGFSFFGGILLHQVFSAKPRAILTGSRVPLALAAILAAVAGLLMAEPSPAARPYFDFFAVTMVFPALVCLAMRIEPTGWLDRGCRFMGLTSYAIYALHAPVGNLVEAGWMKCFREPVSNHAPVIGVVLLALLLPFCWLADRYYDWPFRRLLMRKRLG